MADEHDRCQRSAAQPRCKHCPTASGHSSAAMQTRLGRCDRFGGCMAQAAIVTMSTPRRDAPALMKRAESLGVAIIDRDDIERGRLETLLTALVRQR